MDVEYLLDIKWNPKYCSTSAIYRSSMVKHGEYGFTYVYIIISDTLSNLHPKSQKNNHHLYLLNYPSIPNQSHLLH